jgi:hypothetical protein
MIVLSSKVHTVPVRYTTHQNGFLFKIDFSDLREDPKESAELVTNSPTLPNLVYWPLGVDRDRGKQCPPLSLCLSYTLYIAYRVVLGRSINNVAIELNQTFICICKIYLLAK